MSNSRESLPGRILRRIRGAPPNVILIPAGMQSELGSQNSALTTLRNNYTLTTSAINAYINDGELTGPAFDAHKDYFQVGHIEFIRAFQRFIDDQRIANTTHVSTLSRLPHAYYNRNVSEDMVRQLNWSIPALRALIAASTCRITGWQPQGLINMLNEQIALRSLHQQKLEQIWDYENQTRNLYDTVESSVHNVELLLERISGQRRNPETLIVSLPTLEEAEKMRLVEVKVQSLIDADGKVDVVAVANIFICLIRREWSDFDYQVLLALHLRLNYEQILSIYEHISLVPIEAQYDRLRQDLVGKLAVDVNNLFMEQVAHFQWMHNRFVDLEPEIVKELEEQLLRAQLITFISGTSTVQWGFLNSGFLDLNRFNSVGGPPIINFIGTPYAGTTLVGLWNGFPFVAEQLRSIRAAEQADLMSSSRFEDLMILALMLAGNVKTIAGTAGFKIIKSWSDGVKVIEIVNNVTGQREMVTAAEFHFMQNMGAIGISELGGGAAGMETPNGYRIIGTSVHTQRAMINFAGLYNPPESSDIPQISPETATALMAQIWAPGRDCVVDFLYGSNNVTNRYDFVESLFDTHDRLVEAGTIDAQYRDIDRWPLDVLRQVIDHTTGNGEQSR